MGRTTMVIVAVAAAALLGGCDKKSGGGSAAGDVPQESRDVFTQRCATCHGADGKGTGPAAASLNPKPRDYTDAAWQKTVTDDALKTIIVKGGGGVGKSPLMPPNPDLDSKPDVVAGLVKIVRGFAK